jgi:hypothetical protein
MFTAPQSRTAVRLRVGTVASALVLACVFAVPSPVRASPVETEMLSHAPEILQYLREQGYHRVGVLKFRVKKDGQTTDNAGPLNANLASRLESMLLLKYDMRVDRDVLLLHNASAVAATLSGATHLTAEGREALFTGRYRPLWGDQTPVKADAFLTGHVEFEANLRRVVVNICAFGRDCAPHRVTAFHARTDLNTLAEAGESFNLRTFFTDEETTVRNQANSSTLAAHEAQKAKTGEEDGSLLAGLPVMLEVHYVDRHGGADRKIPIPVKHGKAEIPEPTQDQDVYFRLVRTEQSGARYGVVLMVNGVNTVFEERRPPEQCTKWIFEPDSGPLKVDGFQLTDNEKQSFVVRSPEESAANEVHYGADVGTFSFSLFREQLKAPKPAPGGGLDAEEAKRDEAAVLNPPADLPTDPGPGAPQAKAPKTPEEARKRLEGSGEVVMGLVEKSGFAAESHVHHVSFKNPLLLETITIRYYNPRKR